MSIFEQWTKLCMDGEDTTSSLDSLYDKAEDYFKTKIVSDLDSKNVNKMVSSDLASLISSMGRPLSSTSNDHKVKALHFLLGSIDGIGTNMTGFGLPIKMVQSMGRFFVEHCRPVVLDQSSIVLPNSNPIPESKSDEYGSEDVRDAALNCICSLIKCPIINDDGEQKDEVICSRIAIMQDAIRGRCASLEDDDEDDEDYYDDEGFDDQGNTAQMKILSGLSLLPRAKRSLCFTVLESTLCGISTDIEFHTKKSVGFQAKTIEKFIYFTNFANVCLHGESDPRCLMQMLDILKEIQSVLLPSCFNKDTMSKDMKFPFLSMFDSVAPYYPIKFTPPKNDPWGITREGLQNSLMSVFTCYINHDKAFIDKSVYGDENMIVLAVRLILERLSPPSSYSEGDDDIDVTTQDRIEAVEDLTSLLIIPYESHSLSVGSNWQQIRSVRQMKIFDSLSIEIVKELSVILLRCHEDAAIAVASASKKEDEEENKVLANLCRAVVNNLAYELEIRSQFQIDDNYAEPQRNIKKTVKSFWSCFVSDQITNLCNLMSSSPQTLKGRIAIAYVASLSACGGENTLRLCLDKCIPIFLQLLKHVESPNNDEEQIAIAAYGIGVLFSSSRVSIEKMSNQNVAIHPHPLQEFASQSVQILTKIIVKDGMGLQAKSAAIKAFESVLLSSPHFLLEGTYESTVRHIIEHIGQCVIDSFDAEIVGEDDESLQFNLANAQFTGTAIGTSMENGESSHYEEDSFLKKDTNVEEYLRETLLPKILESSSAVKKGQDAFRTDWKVLAFACQMGESDVSCTILSHLFQTLQKLIQSKASNQIEVTSKAISFLFQKGGVHPIKCVKAKGFHFDLIKFLSGQRPSRNDHDIEMSSLLLPEVRKEKRLEADNTMELAAVALPSLFTAFENGSVDDISILISRVSQLLPPLSEMDQTRLCVILPVLAVLLSEDGLNVRDNDCDILPNLAEYLLTKDNRNIARIAACTCTFAIAAQHLQEENRTIREKVLNQTIMPFFFNKIKAIENSADNEELMGLQDVIYAIAIVGASSMYHVGELSGIIDEAAKFLTSIACDGIVHSSYFGIEDPWDFKGICNNFDIISVTAANGLGSILSMNHVSGVNPFWKQRILHKVYPLIDPKKTSSKLEYGRILCACHLVCCVPTSAFGEKKLSDLTTMILDGLKNSTNAKDGKDDYNQSIIQSVQTASLTSVLKIMNSNPKLVNDHFRTIIPVTLLVLLSTGGKSQEAPSVVIALQILTSIRQLKFSNQKSACEVYRDIVLSAIAKLLDHPSFQIRRATAHTRNIWFIL